MKSTDWLTKVFSSCQNKWILSSTRRDERVKAFGQNPKWMAAIFSKFLASSVYCFGECVCVLDAGTFFCIISLDVKKGKGRKRWLESIWLVGSCFVQHCNKTSVPPFNCYHHHQMQASLGPPKWPPSFIRREQYTSKIGQWCRIDRQIIGPGPRSFTAEYRTGATSKKKAKVGIRQTIEFWAIAFVIMRRHASCSSCEREREGNQSKEGRRRGEVCDKWWRDTTSGQFAIKSSDGVARRRRRLEEKEMRIKKKKKMARLGFSIFPRSMQCFIFSVFY